MGKNIVIKTDENCKFLRTEAVAKAIEYEENRMKDKKQGIYNSVLWIKQSSQSEYHFLIYHTKTSIIVSVSYLGKKN